MSMKKTLTTYLVLVVIAAAILAATVSFELGSHGSGTRQVMQYLSDGCFTTAALYIGCGVLMAIQNAGNFYGVQYLFYTMTRLFSFRQSRYDERKDYFSYCADKRERRRAEGRSHLQPALIAVGLVCLVLSIAFTVLFYRLRP